MAGVNYYSPASQAARSHRLRQIHSGVCIMGGLKRPLSWWAGRRDLAEGKFGGFQKGEVQPPSNSATGGQQ